MFHSDGWDLDLFLYRDEGRIRVAGQVLPNDHRKMSSIFDAVAVLTENNTFVETTKISVNGEFAFESVPDCELQIELFLSSTRITAAFRP